jgi:hypothetical protein
MTLQQVSISSSVPTEIVIQPLTLHLTRGALASTIDETRGMHNAFVDNGSQPGREIARALGDLSHNVYTPAGGVDPVLRAQPGELLFVDYWAAASGMEMFFSNPVALGAADQLFSSREESEWAVAPNGFGFSVPARYGAPARFVAITRAAVRSIDEAVPAMGRVISAGLPAARRRGQISHKLFIRDAGIANQRSASPCCGGSRSRPPSIGEHNWWHTANASSISDCTPMARSTRHSAACSTRYSSNAVLPTPASPDTTTARLSPADTASTNWSNVSRSGWRPISITTRPPRRIRPHPAGQWCSDS